MIWIQSAIGSIENLSTNQNTDNLIMQVCMQNARKGQVVDDSSSMFILLFF